MIVIVRDRQNIFDIALQYFGDLGFASKIITDNSLTWTAKLAAGDKLQINNSGLGNEEVKNFFILSKRYVTNGLLIPVGIENVTFDNDIITWDNINITFDKT